MYEDEAIPFQKIYHFGLDSGLRIRYPTIFPGPNRLLLLYPWSSSNLTCWRLSSILKRVHQFTQKSWIFLLNPITGFKALTGTGMKTENLDSQFHHKICYRTPKKWTFLSFDTWYVWNWGRPSRFSSSAVHAFWMKGYVSLMWDRISILTLENKRVPDSPKNVEWFLSRLPQD